MSLSTSASLGGGWRDWLQYTMQVFYLAGKLIMANIGLC